MTAGSREASSKCISIWHDRSWSAVRTWRYAACGPGLVAPCRRISKEPSHSPAIGAKVVMTGGCECRQPMVKALPIANKVTAAAMVRVFALLQLINFSVWIARVTEAAGLVAEAKLITEAQRPAGAGAEAFAESV